MNLGHQVDDFSVENEPIYSYLAGSPERQKLEAALNKWKDQTTEVPIIIGGKEFKTDKVRTHTAPFDHSKTVAKFYWADEKLIGDAVDNSLQIREDWERFPIGEKIKIFLRAADLIANKYRYDVNAVTMLGENDTVALLEKDSR